MLQRIGTQLATYCNGAAWAKRNEESISNFSNFSFRLLYRMLVMGLGLVEFWQSPDWWYNTPLLWQGYPHHAVSNTVQVLYLLQLAYHLEDLGVVLFEGNKNRKDFAEMLIHHCVTTLLLVGSTRLHTTRIGTIVSTLHAVTDVPKDFAKVCKTLELDLPSKLFFVAFLLSWIVARTYLYPCVYVRSVFVETLPLLEGGMSLGTLRCFQALLSILVLLNTWWFHMIMKIVIKIVKGEKTEDPQLIKKEQVAEAAEQATEENWATMKKVPTDNDSDTDSTVESYSNDCSQDDLSDDDSTTKEQTSQ